MVLVFKAAILATTDLVNLCYLDLQVACIFAVVVDLSVSDSDTDTNCHSLIGFSFGVNDSIYHGMDLNHALGNLYAITVLDV